MYYNHFDLNLQHKKAFKHLMLYKHLKLRGITDVSKNMVEANNKIVLAKL